MYDYRNPFADYNTNIMSSEQISTFFTEPFDLFNISSSEITSDKSSIFFIGARASGKTMLLRQFSYNVQKLSNKYKTFFDKIKAEKYLGIYFRLDTPLLRSLDDFHKYNDIRIADSIFTQFFELTIFKEYLEIVKILFADNNIKQDDKIYQETITELSALIPNYQVNSSECMDDLLKYIIKETNYIWEYQSRKAIDIDDVERFSPSCGIILQGRLTNEFCKCSFFQHLGLSDICILLLIDEFENFSESQQKVINTALRFTKEYGARLRIGMRPNGNKTYDTLTPDDFIKEGRDYRKVEFGNPLILKSNNNLYLELIKKITDKRLGMLPMFNNKNIIDFLGEEESLESEAKEIVKNRTKHFEIYLKEINKLREQAKYKKTKINMESLVRLRDENPLYEMENLLLLLRGETLENVIKAFEDYKNNVDSAGAKKYSNDYDKKYKLSFLLVLCSIYRVEKKGYYGFIDYCQLSSGIIGYFLELCRRAFDLAQFRDFDALLKGKISNKIQTDAAYDYAYSEREMIKRVPQYGGKLYSFIDNIGNVFSVINKDLFIRYPETNQFTIKNTSDDYQKILELAVMCSFVIKKPNAQDVSGKSNKQDIYILNRILAPFYKISYRTRGGLNPVRVTDEYFNVEFNPHSILPERNKNKKKILVDDTQMTLIGFLDNQNNKCIDFDTEDK